MATALRNMFIEVGGEEVTEHTGGGHGFGDDNANWWDLALEQKESWLADAIIERRDGLHENPGSGARWPGLGAHVASSATTHPVPLPSPQGPLRCFVQEMLPAPGPRSP